MRRIAILVWLVAFAAAQEGEEAAEEGLGGLAGGLGWEEAAKPIEFAKVDRRIGKLPELRSPLFGLFLFGINGETRVWAVLDRTGERMGVYDLLYVDRNADGDLTGKDERFEAASAKFVIGDFREPGTDVVHTNFTITWTAQSIRYEMNWAGGPVTMGCFGPAGDTYANFAASPAEAPIFVPGMERPFEFEHWMSGTLRRGKDTDFKVFIGNRGDRTGAFTCVDDKFLTADEFVLAEVICRDRGDKELRWLVKLTERC